MHTYNSFINIILYAYEPTTNLLAKCDDAFGRNAVDARRFLKDFMTFSPSKLESAFFAGVCIPLSSLVGLVKVLKAMVVLY
jgi:hypothetical protein